MVELSLSARLIAESYGIPAEEAPRYFMWRPEGSYDATFMFVDDEGQSWRLLIHDDTIGEAVAPFLEHYGAPVFKSVAERDAYMGEYQRLIKAGASIISARDDALAFVRKPLPNK